MVLSASAGVYCVSHSVSPIGITSVGTFLSTPKARATEPITVSIRGESTTDLARINTKKAIRRVPKSENVAIHGGAKEGHGGVSSTSGALGSRLSSSAPPLSVGEGVSRLAAALFWFWVISDTLVKLKRPRPLDRSPPSPLALLEQACSITYLR